MSGRNRFVGVEDIFDLTVDHPAHTFVANGVVVHNKQPLRRLCEFPGGSTAREGSVCACQAGQGVLLCTSGPPTCRCPEGIRGPYFSSDWNRESGLSAEAILDGQRWTRAVCPDHPSVLAVAPSVDGLGFNALQITERGEGVCGRIENDFALPRGSHWGRVSFDVDSNVPNETVVLARAGVPHFTLLGMSTDDGGVRLFLRARVDAAGQPLSGPAGLWVSSERLEPRQFHAYEWHFERLTNASFRIWPRNAQQFSTEAADGGRLLLEDWYDAGNAFGLVDGGDARGISIGTDGPPGSSDGGGRWYVNRFVISDNGWPE